MERPMRPSEAGVARGRPGAVVIDLGGVLVQFNPQVFGEVFGTRTDDAAWWRFVLQHPAYRGFERGTASLSELAEAAVAELCAPGVDADHFVRALAAWPAQPFPGARAAVEGARRLGVPVVLLSNTNPLHWGVLRAEFESVFDRCFLSYETGELKPDPDAFAGVEAALGVAPTDLLFFDDNAHNIEVARGRGWRAVRVEGPEGIAAEVSALRRAPTG